MRSEDFAALPRLLTFTVDVEDHLGRDGPGPARFAAMTRRLLDFLDERGARGTFFVVGDAAAREPALVREISRRGHEVASHGHRHVPLTREDPARFRRGIRDARRALEDLAGEAVQGFRAPVFSLTAATSGWVVEALGEAGFAYSSSVLPARSVAYGLPGAPERPFLWPDGLLEVPCPLGRAGPLALPFLGGMYLRYLPPWRLRRLAGTLRPENPAVWTYCHPYDLDTEEPFGRAAGRGLVASLFLWCNRGVTAERLRLLMDGRVSVPFRDRLGEFRAGAPVFATPSPERRPGTRLVGQARGR